MKPIRIGGRKLSFVALLAAIMALLGAVGSARATSTYEVVDLGTLPGDRSSAPLGMSDRAQVVGFSTTRSLHAFLWQDGAMIDLGTLPGGEESDAFGINNAGDVVGVSYFPLPPSGRASCGAFLWQRGMMTDLGHLPGGDPNCALGNAINNRGQVVGSSSTSDGGRAFLWQDGAMIDLGTLPGAVGTFTFSTAKGINNRGQVVGTSDAAEGHRHAFLWEDGVMTDLGVLPGHPEADGRAINDRGQVVFSAFGGQGGARVILWQDGVMTDLGQGVAYNINNRGQVVGFISSPAGVRAALWEDGSSHDLTDLIDTNDPLAPYLVLSIATAINNQGQIVAFGHDSRTGTCPSPFAFGFCTIHGYLLTPVHE